MIAVLNLFDIIPGKEAQYAEYLTAVQPLLERYQAKVIWYGRIHSICWGNCRQEYCGLIAYPSMNVLKRLSRDLDFKRIRPLRDESTSNYAMTISEKIPMLQVLPDSSPEAAEKKQQHKIPLKEIR
ncbi:MAG: DUF1330 domain-containing protein [Sedimentisphaerales bacterium]|nr:DUF1330 domain-containing protein [Sedimentisphaerales bacterium]